MDENSISCVNCFNTICEINFLCEFFISCKIHVPYTNTHKWNFKTVFFGVFFTYKLNISYTKTLPFHMWNENVMCENVPIPCVFHVWNDMWNFHKGRSPFPYVAGYMCDLFENKSYVLLLETDLNTPAFRFPYFYCLLFILCWKYIQANYRMKSESWYLFAETVLFMATMLW